MRQVLAYHVVFSTYGFWLPNDPRGSNSDAVWAPHLQEFGPATKVVGRRSHANDPHNADLRYAAKRALLYPAVRLNGLQARAVGRGFARCVDRTGAIVHACAIMPDHVHLVISRHRYEVEKLVSLLKGDATRQLSAESLHPLSTYRNVRDTTPSPWGAGCRKVFLDKVDEIRNRIDYVNQNPIKQHKPAQQWSFITPLDFL
jgi:REP element-mobilizing transposase RayT